MFSDYPRIAVRILPGHRLLTCVSKIDTGWGTLAWARVLSMAVVLAPVSYQSIPPARANPVDALKYE